MGATQSRWKGDYSHGRARRGFEGVIHCLRVAGTAAGALVALLVPLNTGDTWVLFAFPSAFSFAMFSTGNVNMVIFVFFRTAFIIVLLNLAFPGSHGLALARVVDVAKEGKGLN